MTEGWPAAVYLYLIGAGAGIPASEQSHMDQLIAQSCYDHLEPSERETLLAFALWYCQRFLGGWIFI